MSRWTVAQNPKSKFSWTIIVPSYDLVVPPYDLVVPPYNLVVPPYNLVVPPYNLVVPPCEHPGPVRDLALTRSISHRARSRKTEGQGSCGPPEGDELAKGFCRCSLVSMFTGAVAALRAAGRASRAIYSKNFLQDKGSISDKESISDKGSISQKESLSCKIPPKNRPGVCWGVAAPRRRGAR